MTVHPALRPALTPLAVFIPLILILIGNPVAAQGTHKDVLQAVVGIKTQISQDARTASFLGREREGSGIVIDDQGLVLTIGYLILEADSAIITGPDGKQVPATIVAYDHESGLGLLRLSGKLDIKPMRLGNSATVSLQDKILAASRGGDRPVIITEVVSRRVFTGGWEYLLENAIFTSPPHRFHSGAALVGEDGRLLGVGSLFVGNAAGSNVMSPGNMFVPVDALKPALADLLQTGRRSGKKRPWLGANTSEQRGRVFVDRVSPGGPAAKAGIAANDLILGVNGLPISGQADFYRKLWAAGEAGSTVKLNVLPEGGGNFSVKEIPVKTGDRYEWLKLGQSF